MGHRNPQGLAIHPTTGDLWQSEHGPRGGDEINRVTPGANIDGQLVMELNIVDKRLAQPSSNKTGWSNLFIIGIQLCLQVAWHFTKGRAFLNGEITYSLVL